MRTLTWFIAFIAVLFPLLAFSQGAVPTVEILSKDDARELFSTTKEQWLARVRLTVAAGMARPMGAPETGFGMAVTTPEGDLLIVRPSYGMNEQKPDFIQVTVGYRHPRGALLTDSLLKEAIQTAKAQMEPEYDVIGNFERIRGGLSVFFFITEKQPK